MSHHIVVDEQQAQVIAAAGRSIQVRDSSGRLIGFITPAPPAAEIARAKQRISIDEPEYTTQEVLEHLRALSAR